MQIMQTLVVLISAIGAAAFLRKPEVEKALETAPVPNSDVAKLTKKLEQVVGGMDSVYAAQSKSPAGPSKFGEILKPFLSKMHEVLNEVKTDKNLTEAQKLEKLNNAEASVTGLKQDMAKLTTKLKAEGDEDKESILMGVLMSRKSKSEAEQMEVLESDDFKNLEVVKFVLAHRENKTSLAEQVATHLDAMAKKTGGNRTAIKTIAAQTEGIAKQLTGFLTTMEKHLADQEKFHKKVAEKQAKELKEDEAKLKALEGKDKNMQNKTVNMQKKDVAHAIKIVKRRQKKEDREYLKQHSLMAKDVDALRNAIEAVKKGDMGQLAKMQGILQQSMKAMRGNNDFLHFLQLHAWTESESKACPYCKAQCLEKCHNGGISFMKCMGECAEVGN